MTPRDRAAILAAHGLPVFKLSSSRHPMEKKPWEKASRDPDEIEKMLRAGNIGIVTGDDLIVIDIDVKNGARGHESLAVLEAFGLPRDTFTTRTTSTNAAGEPGLHLYFRAPAGHWRNRIGWFPGVDVKGHCHGMVVGPGSRGANGKFYEIERDLPLAELPAMFHAGLAGRSKAVAMAKVPEWCDNAPALRAATAYLVDEAPELGEGERDDGLIKIANRVLDLGVSPLVAIELIVEHWLEAKCVPPVPIEHVEEKVFNAAKSRHDPVGFRPPPPDARECFEAESGGGLIPSKPRAARRLTAWGFIQQREPTIPVIDGLISAGGVYTLTGTTGAGKTGLLQNMDLAVAFNRSDLINHDVEPGNVLALTAENPDKFRDRLILACLERGISEAQLRSARLQVVGGFATTKEMLAEARAMANEGRPPSLITVDTLQAYFNGDDSNANAEVLKFMRSFRPIAELPGKPAVLIAAHPTKGAERLVPYGGGAILNEVDGNFTFTAAPDGKSSKLHWEGKLRESNFEPELFLIEEKSNPALCDGKGRPLKLPLLRPGGVLDATESEERCRDGAARILRLLLAGPQPSTRTIANAIGMPVGSIFRHIKELMHEKLIKRPIDYELTPAGRRKAQSMNLVMAKGIF